MKRRRRRVETVRDGNVRVKIYRRTRTVAGNRYATFEVCDCTSGMRKLRSFANHQAARKEAGRIAQLLAKGDAVAAAMSGREAGNSVTIFAHYRALATEAEGKAWFAIMPPRSPANVVQLPRAADA